MWQKKKKKKFNNIQFESGLSSAVFQTGANVFTRFKCLQHLQYTSGL